MWIRIDSHSGVPIYRQIAAQIEQAVLSGVLQAGDKLPAVRELAVELAVNPATVVKAYDELQLGGLIEQPRGRGTFVLGRPVLAEEQRHERLKSAVEALLVEAEPLGFGPDDVLAELGQHLQEDASADPGWEGERHVGP